MKTKENCSFVLLSLVCAYLTCTNLRLLLVMVAWEQVGDDDGSQRSQEGTSVVGRRGLLPDHHLQRHPSGHHVYG